MLHTITRITRHLFISSFVLIAIVLISIRLIIFGIEFYKTELEATLTELLAAPVKIGQIRAHLAHDLKPELLLKEISLAAPKATAKPNIELKEIHLGIDLWAMLTQRHIVPATWIRLVGAKLSVIHKLDGSFAIVGLQGGDEQPLWLLQGRHYELLQSEITWLDEKNHRPPHLFKQIDVSIKNDTSNQHHRLNLLSQLPRAYGETLRISIDFTGDFFSPNNLNAQLFIAGKKLNFAHLITQELPLNLRVKAGHGDFELWGHWQNSQLTALSGQFNSEKLTLQRPDQKKLSFTQLNSHFDFRNHANSWSLAVDDLAITSAHKKYSPAQFILGSRNKSSQHFGATIRQLDLEAVQNISQFFMPLLGKDSQDFKNLADLNIKGQLSNTLIFADVKQKNYAVKGDFSHISITAPAPYPRIANLSGTLAADEQQGFVILNSQNSHFIAQPMFRSPLAISQLTGTLNWKREDKNWLLSSRDLKLNTPYARSISTLQATIPTDEKPTFIDLRSAFFDFDNVSQAKNYFPVTLMSSGLRSYLDQAFISGQVKHGDLLLSGYLKDFPFIKHQGVFQVLFDAHDVTMKYAQGWPNFEHLDARILFENDSLAVDIKHGKAERATINRAKITIPSFTDSDYVFVENGLASAEINAGLDFLRHTPLDLPLTAVSEQLLLNGNTEVALDLKIPLTDKVRPKITGSAKVAGAKLTVLAVDLPINNLSGMFRFTQDGFYSDTLTAFGLGYPLQGKISHSPENTLINITGKAGITDLQQQFKLPAQDTARGVSNYTVQLSLPFAEKKFPELHIHSNLQGIALALPDSLAKTASESKELTLNFNLINSPTLPINVNYDQQLKANILFSKTEKKLLSGTVLVGKAEMETPQANQFKIKFNQANFSPLAWLSLLDKIQNNNDKARLLTSLEIHTPQLNWSGQQLGLFDLNLHHYSDLWSGTLNCVAGKGQLYIPENTAITDHKIKLEMEQIDLSNLMRLSLPKKATSTPAIIPTKLPLFEINSQKLILRGINLGKLVLDSERYQQGIKFKHFTVTGKTQSLSLTGNWQILKNQEITHINGQLLAENLGELLTKLDLNEDLKETDAQINLDLHWPGAPYQFSLATLSGTMDIDLSPGRISSIEPGFGRLLGVLAVEQWLKRLRLDFGDIYEEGLTFNQISGDFVLANGKATTKNLTVDAVPAIINLTGELNLPEQTMDQQVSVIPKSSGAIPIAGTIVSGIATVVAQTITGEQEEGFYLRSKYRVKGKWNNLNVLPLHEQDGLLKKTWRGLTDFSWITQPD